MEEVGFEAMSKKAGVNNLFGANLNEPQSQWSGARGAAPGGGEEDLNWAEIMGEDTGPGGTGPGQITPTSVAVAKFADALGGAPQYDPYMLYPENEEYEPDDPAYMTVEYRGTNYEITVDDFQRFGPLFDSDNRNTGSFDPVALVSEAEFYFIKAYCDLWDIHKDRPFYTADEILYEEGEQRELPVPQTIKRLMAVHYAKLQHLVQETQNIDLESINYPWHYHTTKFLAAVDESNAKKPVPAMEPHTLVHLIDGVKVRISRFRMACLGGLVYFDEHNWRYEMNADEEQAVLCVNPIVELWEQFMLYMQGKRGLRLASGWGRGGPVGAREPPRTGS